MGRPIVIYGKSGTGKSRSLKNFLPEEVQVFNVLEKDLPFRSRLTHVLNYKDYSQIRIAMSKAVEAGIKVIVIDDCGYLMAGKYLDQIGDNDKKGNAVFQFYAEIAHEFWGLCQFIKTLPNDVNVYLMMHEDKGEDGEIRIGTIGKQLSEKTKIWEWVTIALRCESENGYHFFSTVTNGLDITKAPEEMFTEARIENDLFKVDFSIREYYGLTQLRKAA